MALSSSENPFLVASFKIGGLFHLILSILLPWKALKFIISGGSDQESTSVTLLSELIMRTLDHLILPMAILGNCLEFFLWIILTLWRILRGEVIVPRVGSENYYSMVGLLDYDFDLRKDICNTNPTDARSRYFAYLSIMASKIAYENQSVIRHAVTKQWKMHFVEFFACWNAQLGRRATEAFMVADREEDAELVVLAFRGTEPFDADDWKTDFDFSFFNWQEKGNVHFGFLEALGLAKRRDEKHDSYVEEDPYLKCLDFDVVEDNAGKRRCASPLLLPKSRVAPLDIYDQKSDPEKRLAFYAIVEKLIDVMDKNVNAKLIVTGHSLGAALATLFVGIICGCRDQDLRNKKTMLMDRLFAVYTFGQPRVGDYKFANFLKENVNNKYFRVVYSYDIVPTVPFDDKVFQYKHFGVGHLFDNFYNETNLPDEPQADPRQNFWIESVVSFFPMRLVALWELGGALLRPVLDGKEGWKLRETKLSIISRIFGLFLPGVSAHAPKNYVNAMISVRGKLKEPPPKPFSQERLSRRLFAGAYKYQK